LRIQPARRSWFKRLMIQWLGTKIAIKAEQADDDPDGFHDKADRLKLNMSEMMIRLAPTAFNSE